MNKSNRSPLFIADRDYEIGSPESSMIEIIDTVYEGTLVTRISQYPAIGDEVIIWIKDHYYDNQRGFIVKHRNDHEYLVRITTKEPRKALPGALALVWVYSSDIKIIQEAV